MTVMTVVSLVHGGYECGEQTPSQSEGVTDKGCYTERLRHDHKYSRLDPPRTLPCTSSGRTIALSMYGLTRAASGDAQIWSAKQNIK